MEEMQAELIDALRHAGAKVGSADGQAPTVVRDDGKWLHGIDGRLMTIEEASDHLADLKRRKAGQQRPGDVVVQRHTGASQQMSFLVVRLGATGTEMMPPPYGDEASALRAACAAANGAAVWVVDVRTKQSDSEPDHMLIDCGRVPGFP